MFWILLANDELTSPTSVITILITIVTSVGTGIASVWGWFRNELSDCKKDREKLFARIETMHAADRELDRRIGRLEAEVKGGAT